jgi:hypothetical protein
MIQMMIQWNLDRFLVDLLRFLVMVVVYVQALSSKERKNIIIIIIRQTTKRKRQIVILLEDQIQMIMGMKIEIFVGSVFQEIGDSY